MKTQSDLYRELHSVDELLRDPPLAKLVEEEGQPAVTDACRSVLSRLRGEIAAGALDGRKLSLALSGIEAVLKTELRRALGYSLRPVINGTGVILHTNLGRAPLAESALAAVARVASGYANLEYDTGSGERGSRYVHCAALLEELTGAEDALVVNNGASALMLALNTA